MSVILNGKTEYLGPAESRYIKANGDNVILVCEIQDDPPNGYGICAFPEGEMYVPFAHYPFTDMPFELGNDWVVASYSTDSNIYPDYHAFYPDALDTTIVVTPHISNKFPISGSIVPWGIEYRCSYLRFRISGSMKEEAYRQYASGNWEHTISKSLSRSFYIVPGNPPVSADSNIAFNANLNYTFVRYDKGNIIAEYTPDGGLINLDDEFMFNPPMLVRSRRARGMSFDAVLLNKFSAYFLN